ncbi:MAG: hypothetical protein QM711_13695 [Micropruina sp.]|uniref:hypothetical protein n=1 Tax=Micropruina sp. TaxID=2737536 RepID=UPI0039E4645A
MRTLSGLAAVLRDLVWLTIVQPVQEGRPRSAGWPTGLAAIVAASLTLYVAVGAAVVFAGPLRAADVLLITSQGFTLPDLGAWLCVAGALLSLALLQTAALHLPWWVKLISLMVTIAVLLSMSVTAISDPLSLLPGLVSVLVLLVITIARWRSAFAWWEFVVIALAIGVAFFAPVASSSSLRGFNVDIRGTLAEGALGFMGPLAVPAFLVAGAALAQIAVGASFAAVASSLRSLPKGALRGAGIILVAAAVAQLVAAVPDQESGTDGWIGSAACLVLAGSLIALVLGIAGRAPSWSDLDEDSTRLNYLIAITLVAQLLVSPPLLVLREIGRFAGPEWLFASTDGFLTLAGTDRALSISRLVIALAGLLLTLRLARRGRPWAAMFLSCLTALTAFNLLRSFGIQSWTDNDVDQMSMLLLALLLLTAGVTALTGRLTVLRSAALSSAIVLCLVFPHRSILDDPVSAALGFTGIGAVLFGLVLRLLTEGDITQEGTPKWPVPGRVLLYCANSLLAVTSAAYVALTRSSGSSQDIAVFADLGDFLLGTPLFLTAVIGCLAIALAPSRPVFG